MRTLFVAGKKNENDEKQKHSKNELEGHKLVINKEPPTSKTRTSVELGSRDVFWWEL